MADARFSGGSRCPVRTEPGDRWAAAAQIGRDPDPVGQQLPNGTDPQLLIGQRLPSENRRAYEQDGRGAGLRSPGQNGNGTVGAGETRLIAPRLDALAPFHTPQTMLPLGHSIQSQVQ